MNIDSITLLNWARGSGFEWALAIFIFGTLYRVLTLLMLGRKRNLAPAKSAETSAGVRTVFRRFAPAKGLFSKAPLLHIAGITFHLGFFLILFFYTPHIEALKTVLGFSWPALPNSVITATTVVTMIAMITLLIYRITDPVRRFISDGHDYFIWVISFLPLLTGYLAFNHALLPYTLMLALHILSVELLMVLLPFTRLGHFIAIFFARFYSGSDIGRKGVSS